MKTAQKFIITAISVPLILFLIFIVSVEIISKPLLVESKEAIKAYSGDGEISYIGAPDFGIDGVEIVMPRFNMMDGLNTSYDLSNIPSGDPYSISLFVDLGHDANDELMESIYQGVWTYSIRHNDEVVKELSGKLGDISHTDFLDWINYGTEKEQSIQMLRCSFFSLEDGHEHDDDLDVPDTTGNWSISVTFTNATLNEPFFAYMVLRRGGGK